MILVEKRSLRPLIASAQAISRDLNQPFCSWIPQHRQEYVGNGLLEAKGEGTLEMVKGARWGLGEGRESCYTTKASFCHCRVSRTSQGMVVKGKLLPPRQDILGNRPSKVPIHMIMRLLRFYDPPRLAWDNLLNTFRASSVGSVPFRSPIQIDRF